MLTGVCGLPGGETNAGAQQNSARGGKVESDGVMRSTFKWGKSFGNEAMHCTRVVFRCGELMFELCLQLSSVKKNHPEPPPVHTASVYPSPVSCLSKLCYVTECVTVFPKPTCPPVAFLPSTRRRSINLPRSWRAPELSDSLGRADDPVSWLAASPVPCKQITKCQHARPFKCRAKIASRHVLLFRSDTFLSFGFGHFRQLMPDTSVFPAELKQ